MSARPAARRAPARPPSRGGDAAACCGRAGAERRCRACLAEWSQQQEAPEDARQWEDDWDDDDVSDDFAKQLRAELEKVTTAG